jgi:hypothetical protein
MAFVAVATVGVYPLIRMRVERRYVHEMDDAGFVTRAGTRVAWSAITRVRHISREMDGRVMSEEYEIRSPQGRSCLPISRIGNVREVLDYFIQRVPPEAWVTG